MSAKATMYPNQLPLEGVVQVTFFKRDQLTTDLICCEVVTGRPEKQTFFFHEEMAGWEQLLAHLSQLPGFRADWREAVVHPPFAENRTVAYPVAS
jgi:hypothetical protein